MLIPDLVYMYLWQVFRHIEDNQPVWISDIIAYITTRPFNMKWQEFQELIAYPLRKSINWNEMSSELDIKIESPADKQKTDLYLRTSAEKYDFSIKNYTTTRFQISTMSTKLLHYEERFKYYEKTSTVRLSDEQIGVITNDILHDVANDITIFALTHRKNDVLDIYLLSLRETFLRNIDYMQAEYADREKTPHWRIRIYLKWCNKHLFTLDLGKNALNRGLWWENWKESILDQTLRKEVFYSLLDVSEKNLWPFLAIDPDLKNEAIINIIAEWIVNYRGE